MDPLTNVDRVAAGTTAPADLGKGAEAPADFRQLAAQFESMLLGEMLRELRKSMFEDGDDQSAAPLGDAIFSELTLEPGVTLEAVVRGLNALGASPRDIIAIMQALKAAGALRAELVIL